MLMVFCRGEKYKAGCFWHPARMCVKLLIDVFGVLFSRLRR